MRHSAILDTASGQTGSTTASPRLAGDPGVWVFIAADTGAFALFFALFTLGRMAQPEVYASSARQLSLSLGLLNTVILLCSGWLMALAVAAAQRGDRDRLQRHLLLALLVGSGFGLTKVWEYAQKIQAGITLLSNEFFMYYFVLTGVHFLHFLVGVGVLLVLLSKARQDEMDSRLVVWMESGASYWHMVDLLWLLLFPLLYLQR